MQGRLNTTWYPGAIALWRWRPGRQPIAPTPRTDKTFFSSSNNSKISTSRFNGVEPRLCRVTPDAMASSRIFVKGLPPNITESDLRKHFSSKNREITDIKLIPQRRIGYVGYKTPDVASTAVKYFNRSYIRMSKIAVEIARPVSPFAGSLVRNTNWNARSQMPPHQETRTALASVATHEFGRLLRQRQTMISTQRRGNERSLTSPTPSCESSSKS